MSNLRRPINALGRGIKEPYEKGQILCDLVNGATTTVNFFKGLYYIRGQGGGGGGGNNNYWHNGGGGGSAAGFDGYIRFKKDCTLLVEAGMVGANSASGTDTYIKDIITLSGGRGGASGVAGVGGILQFVADPSIAEIVSYSIYSNGEAGNFSDSGSGNRCYGGNSILTGDGGGPGSAPATMPGAGGGGQIQYGAAGQPGGVGELLIKYEGR